MFLYVVADAGGEMFRPRDKNFAHDAWRFIANHLKTERWARSPDSLLRCEEVCVLKTQ